MAVTEQQRHRLLAWFEEQMGPDLGATMMELLPPNDASQRATKTDLIALRHASKADLAEHRSATRADLAAATAELRSEMGAFRTELADVRGELKADLAGFRAEWKGEVVDLQRTFVTWLVASQAAVIASIGIATGLVLAVG